MFSILKSLGTRCSALSNTGEVNFAIIRNKISNPNIGLKGYKVWLCYENGQPFMKKASKKIISRMAKLF